MRSLTHRVGDATHRMRKKKGTNTKPNIKNQRTMFKNKEEEYQERIFKKRTSTKRQGAKTERHVKNKKHMKQKQGNAKKT